MTVNELLARRNDLHAEMANAPAAKRDSQWFRDRVNEMEFLNRQLARLGAIPPTDPLPELAAAWSPGDDDDEAAEHDEDDEAWWAEHAPSAAQHADVLIPDAESLARTSLVGHQP